jgi:hypothetical protein
MLSTAQAHAGQARIFEAACCILSTSWAWNSAPLLGRCNGYRMWGHTNRCVSPSEHADTTDALHTSAQSKALPAKSTTLETKARKVESPSTFKRLWERHTDSCSKPHNSSSVLQEASSRSKGCKSSRVACEADARTLQTSAR